MRCYHLPVSPNCSTHCRFCTLIGCTNESERSLEDIERGLARAQSGEFARVSFPMGLFSSPHTVKALNRCHTLNLQITLRLDWRVIEADLNLRSRVFALGKSVSLELLCAGDELLTAETVQELEQVFNHVTYRLVPVRGQPLNGFLRRLPEASLAKVDFHFSPYLKNDARRLSVGEVYRLTQRLRKEFPRLSISPPIGSEVWDSRISPDLCLEPHLRPLTLYQMPNSAPRISVVIPSYNSGRLLKNVLRHLLEQTLPRDQYEIIVIDDGSNDGTEELIRNFMAPEATRVNFQFVHFPRTKQRQMGDGNFRAGIARNQGVKLARGEILSFLDSDIITPPNFLADLVEQHGRWDVIQNVRLHLKNEEQNEFVTYASVNRQLDTYIEDRKYWSPFFATSDWNSIPQHWKYTCSYSLSVKTKHFKEVGWFRRTFVYYGFEDTDLGYRLNKKGRKFFLNPNVTYHLYPEKRRSEYRNSSIERHVLLGKTAKIFYLNNLDPQIFEHLRGFMYGELGLEHHLKNWRHSLNLTRDA